MKPDIPVPRSFTWQVDGHHLRANLHLPSRSTRTLVIGSHGLLADRQSPKQVALADACAEAGMAYLRLDHRGCGQSRGDLERDTSLSGRGRDILSAHKALQKHYDFERVGLFGSSFGGAVCISIFTKLKARALITFAAPCHKGPLQRLQEPNQDPWWSGLEFDLTHQLDHLHHVLVVHGSADTLIPLDHARQIHARAGHPKELLIQKDGDHRMGQSHHQRDFIKRSRNWFSKYLIAVQEP